MARVAIVGVGAIGGALAWLLQEAGGHELTLCTRRPIEQLKVVTPSGEVSVTAQNLTEPAQAGPVDWVIVATKAYDAEGAAKWFLGLCAAGAKVAIVQNGVEHRERFAPYLEQDRLLPVIIDCPVEREPNGTVRVRGAAVMKVEDSSLGCDFFALFAGSEAKIDIVADFTTAAWWKLCVNSVGALNALTAKPAGVMRNEAIGGVALGLVTECVAVGRAEGAKLDDSLGDQILGRYRAQAPDSVNSLLADRLAGRRMEVDARNGVIVRKGEKYGIPTPLNRMAVAVLEAL
jgi:2-dehydropantoate 2-reductase